MAYKARTAVVPSAARTTSSNSGQIGMVEVGNTVTVYVEVTAVSGTSPTLDVSVEWSPDGTAFFAAQPADSFTQITATGKVCKAFNAKGPFYRIVWAIGGTATPTFTFATHEYVTA